MTTVFLIIIRLNSLGSVIVWGLWNCGTLLWHFGLLSRNRNSKVSPKFSATSQMMSVKSGCSASSLAVRSLVCPCQLPGVALLFFFCFFFSLSSQVCQETFRPWLVFFFFSVIGWWRSSKKVWWASWHNILLLSFQTISVQYVCFFFPSCAELALFSKSACPWTVIYM